MYVAADTCITKVGTEIIRVHIVQAYTPVKHIHKPHTRLHASDTTSCCSRHTPPTHLHHTPSVNHTTSQSPSQSYTKSIIQVKHTPNTQLLPLYHSQHNTWPTHGASTASHQAVHPKREPLSSWLSTSSTCSLNLRDHNHSTENVKAGGYSSTRHGSGGTWLLWPSIADWLSDYNDVTASPGNHSCVKTNVPANQIVSQTCAYNLRPGGQTRPE
ncbi:hypothetical protein GWK47_043436 [Chionoecetes opilio]|uniref:Uncharacterized protein n=1 Tax=Chionoecetes opilio TaxID=41210 RepID=A0A8J4YAC0_CHIOP|nr:hypothetical protein GWK47_043436 [Chionoecetes opilio]